MKTVFGQFIAQYTQLKYGVIVGLLCFVVPIVLVPGFYDIYEAIKVYLFYILTGLLLFLAVRKKAEVKQVSAANLFIWGAGLFLFAGVLSTIFSVDLVYSLRGADFRYVHGLLFYTVWIGLMFCVAQMEQKIVPLIITALLGASGLVIFQVLFELLANGALLGAAGSIQIRLPGLLGNANFSSFFISVLSAFVFWKASGAETFRQKLLWWLFFLSFFVSLFIFASRANILGFLVGLTLSIVYYFYFRLKAGLGRTAVQLIMWSVVVLAVSVAAFSVIRPQVLKATLGLAETNVQNRVMLWDAGLQVVEKRVFTGVGLGNFGWAYQTWVEEHGFLDASMNDDAHNFFVQLYVTGGAGLLVGFLLMLVGIFALLWKNIKLDARGIEGALAIALIIWLVNACFNPVTVPNMLLFALLAGCALRGSLQAVFVKTQRTLGAIALICGILFLIGEICLNSGILFYNHQKLSEAHIAFSAARFLNPGTRMANTMWVISGVQLEPDKHGLYASKLSQVHPVYGETDFWLGNVYMHQYLVTKDPIALDNSTSSFRRAAQRAPFSDNPVRYYAQSLIEAGKFDEAAIVVKQWVVDKPENFDAWNVLAKVYQKQHNYDGMVWALEKSFGLNNAQGYVGEVLKKIKTGTPASEVEYLIINRVGRF